MALKQNLEPALIEVKSTARGPYHGFGPQDRADLSSAARTAGAEAWLCWWPPRKQPQWIPEKDWPHSQKWIEKHMAAAHELAIKSANNIPGEEKDGARNRT